jgi:hypothetical protein
LTAAGLPLLAKFQSRLTTNPDHKSPEDGSIEIDNSAAERALRVVALGRKNYLFAGSDDGGSYCPSRYLLIN